MIKGNEGFSRMAIRRNCPKFVFRAWTEFPKVAPRGTAISDYR